MIHVQHKQFKMIQGDGITGEERREKRRLGVKGHGKKKQKKLDIFKFGCY